MRKILLTLFLLFFSTSVARATPVGFVWDANPTQEQVVGYIVYDNNVESWKGTINKATIEMIPGQHNVYCKAYTENVNPDGTKVPVFSGPSNVLNVAIPSEPKSLIFDVTFTGTMTLTPK